MIPPKLGAGERLSLNRVSVPVNITIPDERGSAVVWGAALDSPIGPKVVIGVAGAAPDETEARCYLAHLSPSEAMHLAAELLGAAAIIVAAGRVQ